MIRKTWRPAGALVAVVVTALALQRTGSDGPAEGGGAAQLAAPGAGGGAAARAAGEPGAWFGNPLPAASGGVPEDSPEQAPERQAAFMAALRDAPSDARAVRLRVAFTAWLLDAPAHALANGMLLPAEDRRQAMTEAFAALARRHPAVFERYAGVLAGQGTNHGTDLATVIGAVADQDPGRALDWVERHPAFDREGRLGAAIVPALLRTDVASAARAVAAMKERAPPALVQQVAAAYARQDPAQAYAWARGLAAGRADATPARVLDDVSASLVAGDPLAAEQFMQQTADADVRASLMNGLALRKGQEDLGTAWGWLERHAGDAHYADAAQNLLYRSSYARPREVAQILTRVADPVLQANAATHLAQLWQRKDVAGYEAWLATLPPGNLRTAALAGR